MIFSKTVYDKLVIKANAIVIRYQVLVFYSLKNSMIQTNKVVRKRLMMLTKRYPKVVARPERLTTIQKLHILKISYLMLLD